VHLVGFITKESTTVYTVGGKGMWY